MATPGKSNKLPSSFRDPSGFLFRKKGILYRHIGESYKEHFDFLINSRLYHELIQKKLLIKHINKSENVIKPEVIPFISYPYEWSFSMFKDAALTTLKIQKTALKYDMVLKDSSAYNIQFLNGKPLLIDTLSFEKYKEGEPWIAYRQFCQHFLAPLALAAYTDVRLFQLMRVYIDGIPLDLASKLLPKKSRLNFGLLSHLVLHASSQKKYEDTNSKIVNHKSKISKERLNILIDNLANTISSLKWRHVGTEWGDYYNETNYSDEAFEEKKKLVKKYILKSEAKTLWDLGANTGEFARLASEEDIQTVAFDIDPLAVEKNYRGVVGNSENNLLPLIMDLANPSPALGWLHKERDSLVDRGPVDTVLALALIHHLAISNNLPFENIAEFFAGLCTNLIIEFVPKGDSQVDILLSTREDIFNQYDKENFEKVFNKYFKIVHSQDVAGSKRTLYYMKKQ